MRASFSLAVLAVLGCGRAVQVPCRKDDWIGSWQFKTEGAGIVGYGNAMFSIDAGNALLASAVPTNAKMYVNSWAGAMSFTIKEVRAAHDSIYFVLDQDRPWGRRFNFRGRCEAGGRMSGDFEGTKELGRWTMRRVP